MGAENQITLEGEEKWEAMVWPCCFPGRGGGRRTGG